MAILVSLASLIVLIRQIDLSPGLAIHADGGVVAALPVLAY
jgi:hypothetical protein